MFSPGAGLMAFALAAALLTVTPGLDTALVLRTSALDGRRRALECVLGIAVGLTCWALIAAMGLGAVLAASRFGYDVLRFAGALYLCYVGLGLLLRPRGSSAVVVDAPGPAGGFRRGLMTNLLNPKAGAFYVSFLPQFVPPGADAFARTLVLAGIHILMGVLWFGLLISAAQSVARFLRRGSTVLWLDRITGSVFLAFAARLALEPDR